MRQYLVEGVAGGFEFLVDRTQPFVTESKPAGKGPGYTRIPGRFSVCDCINGNNRRYRRNVWEKNLKDGSVLQESIKRSAAFGLLEHPKDGIVTLLSPISHIVTKAEMVENRNQAGKPIHEVIGEISIVETEEGRKLKALIEAGYNPLVSSRGYGSLEKASDGVDEVLEDYVCEGWDVVIKPSFENAELAPSREPLSTEQPRLAAPVESKQAKAEKVLTEQEDPPAATAEEPAPAPAEEAPKETPAEAPAPEPTQENLKAVPSTGAVGTVTSAPKPSNNAMIQNIKSRISTLESVDPSKLNAQRFAEHMAVIEEAHQEVADYAAEDPKRGWEAQKLHKQLDTIAGRFSESAQAPSKAAKKLQEHNTKLMRVINAVAGTAVTYKKKLAEAISSDTNKTKLVEELTTRGRGWQKLAETRKQAVEVKEGDLNTACEALDIMAKRYHEDTTQLGRRVLQLEFKEQLEAKPGLQKKLKEAKRLRHVLAIREELEGKIQENEPGVGTPAEGEAPGTEAIKGKKKGEGKGEGDKVADEPGKVANESQANKDGKKPVTEAKEAPKTEGKVLLKNYADPRSLSESVAMVQRLSNSTK